MEPINTLTACLCVGVVAPETEKCKWTRDCVCLLECVGKWLLISVCTCGCEGLGVSPLPCYFDTVKFTQLRRVKQSELASHIFCGQHQCNPWKTFKFKRFGFALSVETLV